MSTFSERLGDAPLIGVVHLLPLPGAPRFCGTMNAVIERALADAGAILEGGMQGVIVENFGDAPFYPAAVPAETVAAMARVVAAVVDVAGESPVGVNVLRNDAHAAVAVAAASGAAFIRVNVHVGAAWTDQGLIEGRAYETLRLRERLAPETLILADVGVKHATRAGDRPLAEEAADAAGRGGADALIVTGSGTGRAAREEDIAEVVRATGGVPVLVGSGVTEATVESVLAVADGIIVGSCLRADGRAGGEVDPRLVAALTSRARGRSA